MQLKTKQLEQNTFILIEIHGFSLTIMLTKKN